MYFEIVPTLSRGPFALYYGGRAVVPLLSHSVGSPVTPGFLCFSVLLQLIVILYKKCQAKRLKPTFKNTGELFSSFSRNLSLPQSVCFLPNFNDEKTNRELNNSFEVEIVV